MFVANKGRQSHSPYLNHQMHLRLVVDVANLVAVIEALIMPDDPSTGHCSTVSNRSFLRQIAAGRATVHCSLVCFAEEAFERLFVYYNWTVLPTCRFRRLPKQIITTRFAHRRSELFMSGGANGANESIAMPPPPMQLRLHEFTNRGLVRAVIIPYCTGADNKPNTFGPAWPKQFALSIRSNKRIMSIRSLPNRTSRVAMHASIAQHALCDTHPRQRGVINCLEAKGGDFGDRFDCSQLRSLRPMARFDRQQLRRLFY